MSPLAHIFCFLVRVYQHSLGLIFGRCCRFEPSCSNYMLDAIRIHGVGYGVLLGIRRVARCHPWNPGGHDPVPPKQEKSI